MSSITLPSASTITANLVSSILSPTSHPPSHFWTRRDLWNHSIQSPHFIMSKSKPRNVQWFGLRSHRPEKSHKITMPWGTKKKGTSHIHSTHYCQVLQRTCDTWGLEKFLGFDQKGVPGLSYTSPIWASSNTFLTLGIILDYCGQNNSQPLL